MKLTVSIKHDQKSKHVKFVMVINNKKFQNLFKIIKILILMAFLHPLDLIFRLYLVFGIIIQKEKRKRKLQV